MDHQLEYSDVNVGGPDGDPPYCTVGTVMVHYDGSDSREWLWHALDKVRQEYDERYNHEPRPRPDPS